MCGTAPIFEKLLMSAFTCITAAALASSTTTTMSATAFSSAHRLYVKSLYRRYLKNTLDWTIRRDVWRAQAMQIRADFEANR